MFKFLYFHYFCLNLDSFNSLIRDKTPSPVWSGPEPRISDFIDLSFWKRQKTCCGTIFVGPTGEAMVDPRFLHPCILKTGHSPEKKSNDQNTNDPTDNQSTASFNSD